MLSTLIGSIETAVIIKDMCGISLSECHAASWKSGVSPGSQSYNNQPYIEMRMYEQNLNYYINLDLTMLQPLRIGSLEDLCCI